MKRFKDNMRKVVSNIIANYKMMMENTQDGVMYLLHVNEGNDATREVVDRAIPVLKEMGFEFVTAPKLFELKGVEMKDNGQNWTVV